LVIVDEVGYTPIDRQECNLFFCFIAIRYEKASTIITSNKVFSDWAEIFHDPIIVSAFLDRLLHHSTIINIKGNSYRLKGKLSEKGVTQLHQMKEGGSNLTTNYGSVLNDH
jgi:DNA replication protein DnaC